VLRWPLQTCGDGHVNATYAFEECDYAKKPGPPIDITTDTYNYPAPTKTGATKNQRGDYAAGGGGNTPIEYYKTGGYWSGEYSIWWDKDVKKYYRCDTICKKQELNLCGDGVPSNGRVSDGAGGFKASPTN
jgi:hypothetical protein